MNKLIFALLIIFASCSNKKESTATEAINDTTTTVDSSAQIVQQVVSNNNQQPDTAQPQISGKNITYKIIPGEESTFGYDILVDGIVSIHQPIIPGKPGNKGFARKEDAGKIGQLVAYKIQHNMMPPSVSDHELDSLGVK